jgi:predicted MFS family arabinose efflux permease
MQSILISGILFSTVFLLLGFQSSVLAGVLIVVFGGVQGLVSVTQEIIQTNVSDKESYGTDIGLLWMGYHLGESLSLALAGYLISVWGYVAPFFLAALTFTIFSVGAHRCLKQ